MLLVRATGQQIGFVEQDYYAFVAMLDGQFLQYAVCVMHIGEVDDPQYDFRVMELLVGFLYAQGLYDVGAFAYSSRVGQAKWKPLNINCIFYYIACGAVNITYYGFLLVCQQI